MTAGYFDFFNYSGIHRSVWLIRTPEEAIQDCDLTYCLEDGRAFVNYSVNAEGEYIVCVELRDPEGTLVASGQGKTGELTVETPHLWQVRNEMIKRDKHHPSVFAWSIFNEAETITQASHDYFAPLFDLARQLSPERRPVTGVLEKNSSPDRCATPSWTLSA